MKIVRPVMVAISVHTDRDAEQRSGVITDSSGRVLTSNHVVIATVDGNGKITVELRDRRLCKAEIVERDVLIDLAIIKIVDPPKDLIVVALGDSSKFRAGESIAVIGSSLGLFSAMVAGIVPTLDRTAWVDAALGSKGEEDDDPGFDLRGFFGDDLGGSGDDLTRSQSRLKPKDDVYINAIQVGVAMNLGNSGGPLFDAEGQVIGVISSIVVPSGGDMVMGSIGLGSVISVNQAQMTTTQLIEHGEAVYAALGIAAGNDIASIDEMSRLGALV